MDNLQDMIDSIQESGGGCSIESEEGVRKASKKACNRCHQIGHFANKCPIVSEKRKSRLRCHICGNTGHNRSQCPGVDDGGASQSKLKNVSTAKNNTGEKKKKGKDKVRAQKMMRGKKKERGQSIDEKEVQLIQYPQVSTPFYDFLSKVTSPPRQDVGHEEESNTDASLCCDFLAGYVAPCSPSCDTSYDLMFPSSLPVCNKSLLGYAVGIPPEYSSQWLKHIELNGGVDLIFNDILKHLGNKLRAIGPVGLDYTSGTLSKISATVQKSAFREQISIAQNLISSSSSSLLYILIRVCASDAISLSSQCVLEDIPDIDRDFFKTLHDANLQESSLSIVVSLAECGLKFSTIEALLMTFPNLYFSLDGRLTHSKQKLLKEHTFDIPLSRIVFASMSPLHPVAPSSVGGLSMQTSDSSHTLFVADALAKIKNCSLEDVLEQILENSTKILHL